MRSFDAELTDSNDVRAYASKNNWDGDGMDSDMFDQAVASGIKGKQPKDFVKAKFLESAEQLLQPYLSQYSETGTTVSAIRERERVDVAEELLVVVIVTTIGTRRALSTNNCRCQKVVWNDSVS